ncbi:MAG: DUF1641 domain-containing protein [Myxococcota bacterium]
MTMTTYARPGAGEDTPARTRSLEETVARLDDRLERIERTLEPIAKLSVEAPRLGATVGDMADAWAAEVGDADQRLLGLQQVLERVTRPGTLASLRAALDMAEEAPRMLATFTDIADETVAEAAEHGIEPHRLVEDTKQLVFGLLKLTTSPELRALRESGMLDPQALHTLGLAAQAVAHASETEPPKLGLFGAARAMKDGDVQRAVGFTLRLARGFGRALRREAKRLA